MHRQTRTPEWVIHSIYIPRRDGPRRLEQAFQLLLGSPPDPQSNFPCLDRSPGHESRDLRSCLDRQAGT
jgi:hypothetical protein